MSSPVRSKYGIGGWGRTYRFRRLAILVDRIERLVACNARLEAYETSDPKDRRALELGSFTKRIGFLESWVDREADKLTAALLLKQLAAKQARHGERVDDTQAA